jgi:hypothetical protein
MSRYRPKLVLAAATAILLTTTGSKCVKDDVPDDNGQPWTMASIGEAAVLYRDAPLRSDTDFSLRNVLKTILASEGLPTGAAAEEALLTSLLQSFGTTSAANPGSGLPMRVQVRNTERTLSAAALLDPANADGMIPVGLFNRIDQMPADASNCGEHRIVFSTKDNRFLLIFEAKLPNKSGGTAQDCAAIGAFWAKAGKIADPAARLTELKKLYFAGFDGFVPVVRAKNYGIGLGQVRSNTFRDTPWQLREWRIDPVPGALAFTPQPVATNPLAEFYQDNNAGTLNPALPLQESERLAFQDKFDNEYNDQLLETDTAPGALAGVSQEVWLINTFGAKIDGRFNEFQSDSAFGNDQVQTKLGPQFKARFSGFQPGNAQHEVTVDQVANRASAITCGGCHGTKLVGPVGKLNGAVLNWPDPLGLFRHIDTSTNGTGQSNISAALNDFFLPFRRASLVEFLNDSGSSDAALVAASGPDPLEDAFSAIVKSSDQPGALTTGAEDFRKQVEQRRAEERAKPGRFVKHRRPH